MTRDEMRTKLWCDVYVTSLPGLPGRPRHLSHLFADEAVIEFDKRFPTMDVVDHVTHPNDQA